MKKLLDQLKLEEVIKSDLVYNSMIQVDRGDFTDSFPYFDSPQRIGFNATISAPHMHAYALEYLYPALNNFKNFNPSNFRFLDIGSGSGYLTVCLFRNCSRDRAYSRIIFKGRK